jgi:hypothetical protein
MRLLVFGETGQLARELARRCPPGVEASFLGRAEADLSEPSSCAAAIIDSAADAVINAAAWTAVDRAEAEEAAATVANGAAPGAMARACAAKGIPFLHVSTDYVFDGAGDAPFAPGHAPAPLNAYGRSKLAGEAAVRASGARHVILRTSWVFSGFGNNFLKTMLRLGRERESLEGCLRPGRRADPGRSPCRRALRRSTGHGSWATWGDLSLFGGTGRQLGRLRARHHGGRGPFLPDRGYLLRRLPHSGPTAAELPPRLFDVSPATSG